MKSPMDDRFYNETPFLTVERVLGDRVKKTKQYIKDNNITTAVITFNENLFKTLKKIGKVKKLEFVYMGEDKHYFYAVDNVLFVVAFMSAPNAACLMENLIYMGIKNIIATGSAGLIDNSFGADTILIVDSAIRDEGTSYHYAEPTFPATTDKTINIAIEKVLKRNKIKYDFGKIWTTDGLLRETPSLINKRVAEGCVAVDMECSAWCVVAKKFNIRFGEFVYFSDAVVEKEWGWFNNNEFDSTTDKITLLAYEMAKELD